jgi:hypothetical protein
MNQSRDFLEANGFFNDYVDANFFWHIPVSNLLLREHIISNTDIAKGVIPPNKLQSLVSSLYQTDEDKAKLNDYYKYFLLLDVKKLKILKAPDDSWATFFNSLNRNGAFNDCYKIEEDYSEYHSVARYHTYRRVIRRIASGAATWSGLNIPILLPQPDNILGAEVFIKHLKESDKPVNASDPVPINSTMIYGLPKGPFLSPETKSFWLFEEYAKQLQFYGKSPWWTSELATIFSGISEKPEMETPIHGIEKGLSFYGDYVSDLACALFWPETSQIEQNYVVQELNRVIYPFKQARQSWLAKWASALSRRVQLMSKAKAFQKEDPVEFYQAAIRYMSECILGADPSEKSCYDDLSNSISEMVSGKQVNYSLLNDDNKLRIHYARFNYVNVFINSCLELVNEALGSGVVSKIQGSKSKEIVRKLAKYAYTSPNGRVLLVGKAGGGKSLAAKEYHSFCLQAIDDNDQDFHRFVGGIWKSIISLLLDLPGTRKEFKKDNNEKPTRNWFRKPKGSDDTDLIYLFTRRQLRGTKWWDWKAPTRCRRNGEPCASLTHFVDEIFKHLEVKEESCDVNGWESHHSKEICPSCMCAAIQILPKQSLTAIKNIAKDAKKYSSIVKGLQEDKFKQIKLIGILPTSQSYKATIAFIIYYIGRLISTLFPTRFGGEYAHGGKDPDYEKNFIHVNCGMFGGEGSNPEMIMRQLFGKGSIDPLGDSSECTPGLFQIASYMGGTVFLDEIADAPIALQDRLLMALEEKKVFRLGWETISESVDNIRIVAATHKDLPLAVQRYRETVDSGSPMGFRPDLLNRLAVNPPVTVVPIPDYFLYNDGDAEANNTRENCINDFCMILEVLLIKELKKLNSGMAEYPMQFFREVYDKIDEFLLAEVARAPNLDDDAKRAEKKRKAEMLTMRLINALIENYARGSDELESSQVILGNINVLLSSLEGRDDHPDELIKTIEKLVAAIKYYDVMNINTVTLVPLIRKLILKVDELKGNDYIKNYKESMGEVLTGSISSTAGNLADFQQRKEFIINQWLPDNLRFLMHQP